MDDYANQLENQIEELQKKLAQEQLSVRSLELLHEFIMKNSTVTKIIDKDAKPEDTYLSAKSIFGITKNDIEASKSFPKAYEIFKMYEGKAIDDEKNNEGLEF